jgi:membrane-bound lytic murein transglycosylase A
MKKLDVSKYPVFKDSLDFKGLKTSIDRSLAYLKKIPPQRKFRYAEDEYTASYLIKSMNVFSNFLSRDPGQEELNRFLRSGFLVYEAVGNKEGKVIFTGYFEPTCEGCLKKGNQCIWPVYSRPDDLFEINLAAFSSRYRGYPRLMARIDQAGKQVVPYYSRAGINALPDFAGRAKPLVWLKSRVDRFFLEIQGSGRVELENGEILRLHYAAANGRPYRSIGRYLIRKNEIAEKDMSMQAIRTWLELHPERMDEILNHNESFVFFRREKGGPYGSLGVEVTAMRSIATDPCCFPKASLCFVTTKLADRVNINPLKKWEKADFFVMNQDTGGAIKGPARADIFFGSSLYARFAAGHMNQKGRLFFLVLKPDSMAGTEF